MKRILTFPADGIRLAHHLKGEAEICGVTSAALGRALDMTKQAVSSQLLRQTPAVELRTLMRLADELGFELRIGLRWKETPWISPADKLTLKRAQASARNKMQRPCPKCGEYIRLGNWSRHLREVHGMAPQPVPAAPVHNATTLGLFDMQGGAQCS